MIKNWKKEDNDWISYAVSTEEELEAISIRASRDKYLGNHFEPEATDARWVGDLGEIVFSKFLDFLNIKYDWIKMDVVGAPDFILLHSKNNCFNNTSVDVKTVKRKGPFLSGYQAQVLAAHKYNKIDHYFFLSYEFPKKKMWLIGGCGKEFYFSNAIYYPSGSKIHEHYSTRQKNHNIYNISEDFLAPSKKWLWSLVKKE